MFVMVYLLDNFNYEAIELVIYAHKSSAGSDVYNFG